MAPDAQARPAGHDHVASGLRIDRSDALPADRRKEQAVVSALTDRVDDAAVGHHDGNALGLVGSLHRQRLRLRDLRCDRERCRSAAVRFRRRFFGAGTSGPDS